MRQVFHPQGGGAEPVPEIPQGRTGAPPSRRAGPPLTPCPLSQGEGGRKAVGEGFNGGVKTPPP